MRNKNLLFQILGISSAAFIVTLSSLQAPLAAKGGFNGGGGARVEGSFRSRGADLIHRISTVPAAEKICASSILSEALDSSQIRVVSSLLDPQTGKPILEDLDAWTVPGDIQLLKNSWEKFFPVHQGQFDQSVDKLILHEILRATGEKCPDEKFEKSGRIISLLSEVSERTLQRLLREVIYRNRWHCTGIPCYAVWARAISAMDLLSDYVDLELKKTQKLSEHTGKLAQSAVGAICGGSVTAEAAWFQKLENASKRTLLRLEKLRRLAGITEPLRCRKWDF